MACASDMIETVREIDPMTTERTGRNMGDSSSPLSRLQSEAVSPSSKTVFSESKKSRGLLEEQLDELRKQTEDARREARFSKVVSIVGLAISALSLAAAITSLVLSLFR